SQELENTRIDSLYNRINYLENEINALKDSIQDEILKYGYPIKVKKQVSYSEIKLFDKEVGPTVLDTVYQNKIITILDKTTSYFKVRYNDKIGYIYAYYLDTSDYPILKYLQ